MTTYYNEWEAYPAAWLRNLIAAGELPAGTVDETDIREVKGTDLERYTQCHFFAGVGGWDVALRLAGWPADRPAWTGSCPCPPFSCAGKKKRCPECQSKNLMPHPFRTGHFVCCDCQHDWLADGRHLWPEFYRLIAECMPECVFGEQVASADGLVWLAGVQASMEALGYAFWRADYPAAGVGAPHIRQRLWWVAHTPGSLRQSGGTQPSERAAEGPGSRLADFQSGDGRLPVRQEPRSEISQSKWCGEAGGLALPIDCDRRAGVARGHDGNGQDAGRQEADGELAACGEAGGVGNAECECGKEPGSAGPAAAARAGFGRSGVPLAAAWVPCECGEFVCRIHGMHACDCPCPPIEEWECDPYTSGFGPWDGAIWLPCADGKARRVSPLVLPLAYELPANLGCDGPGETSPFRIIRDPQTGKSIGQAPWRIGMIRGYGNSIVPAVAATFIRAFLECEGVGQ